MGLFWTTLVALGGVGVVFGAGRYMSTQRRRQQRAAYPLPTSLIIEPTVEAAVTRRAPGHYEVHWRRVVEIAHVAVGSAPTGPDPDGPVVTASHTDHVLFHELSHRTRPYFHVTLDQEAPFVVAERALPLTGVPNARDIGGYRTADGQRVRWGQVYRSGSLGGATDADLELLQSLGIRLVCDLRSADEVADAADRLPQNPAPVYQHLPIEGGSRTRDQLRTILLNPHNLPALMDKTYTEHFIGESGPVFGTMLRAMADPANLPILVHCTAGKDRTGVTIALLLAALGVPDEVIVADYSLSNRFFTTFRDFIAGKFQQPQAFLFGIHIDDFQPLITAPPQTMQHMLTYIRQRYGSIETYMDQTAGVDADTLAAIRANLLA